MDWFYAKNGQQNGPVEKEKLEELFRSGQISSGDLVWNDSMTDWAPIGTLPEFSDTGVPASTAESPASGSPTLAAEAAATVSQSQLSPAPAPAYTGEKIPNYLWQSIVAIIFCCLPAAVVSLVYAIKVDPAVATGDIAAAKEASKNAKMWFWIAFGVGLVVNIIFFAFGIIGAIAEEANM